MRGRLSQPRIQNSRKDFVSTTHSEPENQKYFQLKTLKSISTLYIMECPSKKYCLFLSVLLQLNPSWTPKVNYNCTLNMAHITCLPCYAKDLCNEELQNKNYPWVTVSRNSYRLNRGYPSQSSKENYKITLKIWSALWKRYHHILFE